MERQVREGVRREGKEEESRVEQGLGGWETVCETNLHHCKRNTILIQSGMKDDITEVRSSNSHNLAENLEDNLSGLLITPQLQKAKQYDEAVPTWGLL